MDWYPIVEALSHDEMLALTRHLNTVETGRWPGGSHVINYLGNHF
jgi:hypothetical protein